MPPVAEVSAALDSEPSDVAGGESSKDNIFEWLSNL
jgi:hypothetical protein